MCTLSNKKINGRNFISVSYDSIFERKQENDDSRTTENSSASRPIRTVYKVKQIAKVAS